METDAKTPDGSKKMTKDELLILHIQFRRLCDELGDTIGQISDGLIEHPDMYDPVWKDVRACLAALKEGHIGKVYLAGEWLKPEGWPDPPWCEPLR